jgi:DNA uptake protein ComE-like DNA-binding protein
MSIQPEHKALVFVAAIAVLGGGVRILRAASGQRPDGAQPALEVQRKAADSAAQAQVTGRRKAGSRRNAESRLARQTSDTGQRKPRRSAAHPDTAGHAQPSPDALLDRPGYVRGKLDLDVATAAQIDSLPGVTPNFARRIVADRMMRGPFLSRDGLRRVEGVGPTFLAKIDTLVTFSGTVVQRNPSDTVIPPKKRKRMPRRGSLDPVAPRSTGFSLP